MAPKPMAKAGSSKKNVRKSKKGEGDGGEEEQALWLAVNAGGRLFTFANHGPLPGQPSDLRLVVLLGSKASVEAATRAVADLIRSASLDAHLRVQGTSPPVPSVAAAAVDDLPSRFPWLHDHSPGPPPPPSVRHIRKRRGRWRAAAADGL